MVNSGKRKYTKKTIMRGGAILFDLIPFTDDGRYILPGPYPQMTGDSVLEFIDGTHDTFFRSFRRVKFSKSFSKCYLVKQGNRNVPYQLIYRDGNVFQYTANNINRFRIVKQNSQMSDEAIAEFLSLPPGTTNEDVRFIETGRGKPTLYLEWDRKLKNAIENGEISIDQLYNFFYTNGNRNKSFKADKKLERFWNVFEHTYKDQFF
jgi:hypothetical protein